VSLKQQRPRVVVAPGAVGESFAAGDDVELLLVAVFPIDRGESPSVPYLVEAHRQASHLE